MTRIGIVGAGFMGATHAAGWDQTNAELVGIHADSDTPPDELAGKYGARAYADLESLLADVDVIDICAPTHLHAEMVEAAAASGTHVICEKPLARTAAQTKQMIETCKKAGVQLFVAHVVRFFPEFAAARNAVVSGEIGDPAVVRLSRTSFQPKKDANNWFLDKKKSGGLVLDLMVHDLDYARWVGGDVVSVYAKALSTVRPDAPVDHALAILTHSNGVISHVEASWAHPPPTFRTRGEIAGTTGVLSWDSERDAPFKPNLRASAEADDVAIPGTALAEDPYTTELKHFLECLESDVEPIVTAEDGFAALELAEAVTASLETGGLIKLGVATATQEVSA